MSSNLAVINLLLVDTSYLENNIGWNHPSRVPGYSGLTTTSQIPLNFDLHFTPTPSQTPTLILSTDDENMWIPPTDGFNKRITDTDADQRHIDGSYNALNKRITDTDSSCEDVYIDRLTRLIHPSLIKFLFLNITKRIHGAVQLFSKPYVEQTHTNERWP
jgi:hypothetical protein